MIDFKEFDEPVEGSVTLPMTGDETAVLYLKDIVYARYGETELHLQILLPNSQNRRIRLLPTPDALRDISGQPAPDWSYPCFVFVPGSAWAKQNVYANLASLTAYVRRGFAVAIVEYRDYDIAHFPAPVVDARNAVRFLKKHAEPLAIDPERILLAGSSSGGHTAAYAGIFHDDNEDTNLFPGISGEVQGIVNFYGSTDFTFADSNPINGGRRLTPDTPEGKEMGADMTDRPDLVRKLTVACNITPETEITPMLIFHGTADMVVNTRCSVNLYRRLKDCGKDARLFLMKGSEHGGPEFYAPRILNIIEDFALEVFGK